MSYVQLRKFHPEVGQKVWITTNITVGLDPIHFREPQVIESVHKISVDDVEDGYMYTIDLKNIPYLFTEFDVEPIDKALEFALTLREK